MSSPAPTTLPGGRNAVRITPSETAPLPAAVQAALTPGNVLEVQVREHLGERGVFVQGKFLPAALPAGVAEGERLTVQVVSNRDAVVLRILNAPTAPTTQQTSLFSTLLEELLPKREVDMLRALRGQPAGVPLQIDLPELMRGLERAPRGGSVSREIGEALRRLMARAPILTPEALEDPRTLTQLLAQASQRRPAGQGGEAELLLRSVAEGIEEATRLVREVGREPAAGRRAPAELRFVTALRDQLTTVLSDAAPLDFERAGTPAAALEGNVRLYLAASHYAVMSGRSEALEQISRQITRASGRENPLILLMQALGTFHFPEGDDSSRLHEGFAGGVEELLTDLHQLRQKRAGDPEMREVLKRHHDRLTRLISEERPAVREAELVAQGAELMKHLETAAAGQEVLRQLAPVLQALQEPALFILPALLPGFLSNLELRVEPRRVHPDGDGAHPDRPGEESFEQIHLSLTLPGLGPLHLALARRAGEVLLNLTCASEAVAAHLRAELPKLADRIQSGGECTLVVNVKAGVPLTAAPAWYHMTTARSVVA